MTQPDDPQWSDELQAKTRLALANGDALGAGGALHLKHIRGGFGRIEAEDLLNGRLRVIEARSGEASEFQEAGALIRAGWVVD